MPTADELERAVARLMARADTGGALDAGDEAALGALAEAGPFARGSFPDPEPALIALLSDEAVTDPPLELFEALAIHGGVASLEPLRRLTGFFADERVRPAAGAAIEIIEERCAAGIGALSLASPEVGALSSVDEAGALELTGQEEGEE